MKKINIFIVFVIFFSWFYVDFGVAIANDAGEKIIKLTQPKYDGEISVERALKERRSIRSYKTEPLTLDIISQILWAAQGVTEPQRGLRTAPSARAQYLLEVYLVAGNITNLKPGIYRYIPKDHTLLLISHGEMKERLYSAAGQAPIKAAPCALLITGHANRSKKPGMDVS
ncbi:MAG: SagB/ThcOx family dehydrogenase [Syntrophorhabdaceae bacterium]|nr:SagB/ThcOx family dehydrogenase [Syntrophorhabdaceae bacterium]